MRQEGAAGACRQAPQTPLGASRKSKWLGECEALTALGVRGGLPDMAGKLRRCNEAMDGWRRHSHGQQGWLAMATMALVWSGHCARVWQRRVCSVAFPVAEPRCRGASVPETGSPQLRSFGCSRTRPNKQRDTLAERGRLDSGTGRQAGRQAASKIVGRVREESRGAGLCKVSS